MGYQFIEPLDESRHNESESDDGYDDVESEISYNHESEEMLLLEQINVLINENSSLKTSITTSQETIDLLQEKNQLLKKENVFLRNNNWIIIFVNSILCGFLCSCSIFHKLF